LSPLQLRMGSAWPVCHLPFSPNPYILCHSYFAKSLSTARKSLRIFRKLSRRSNMTRPWWECICEQLSKRQLRRTRGGRPEAPLRKDFYWWKNVKKLAQAHGMMTKMVHATLQKDLKLSKKLARWMTKLL
jgi:hypothetical protein